MSVRIFIMASIAAFLAGCSSTEYRATQSICQAQGLEAIPALYETVLVDKYRTEEQTVGTTCETYENERGNQQTDCKPLVEEVRIPYTSRETRDVRTAERNAWTQACVVRRCVELYGHPKCEAD